MLRSSGSFRNRSRSGWTQCWESPTIALAPTCSKWVYSKWVWALSFQELSFPWPSLSLLKSPASAYGQFSYSVESDSLRPHEPQHTRPPYPSPTPGVYPNPCPLCRWCHATISSSVVPFSSCPQSFPASGSIQMSQLFASGGQSIGVSASASVFPMNTQYWSPLGWTGWISLQSKGLFKSLLKHHSSKASILLHSAFFIVQLSHPYVTTEKTIALTSWNVLTK